MDNRNKNENYDNWQAAWDDRVEDVDNNIVSWWDESWHSTSQSLDVLQDKIANWWDSLTTNDKADAEWKKARADRKVLEARIEQRVTHLVENGKVKLAKERAEHNR